MCFDTNANTGATDAIRFSSGGTVIHNYALSGKNAAGDADVLRLTAAQLAYVTIPVAQAQASAPARTSRATLHGS